MGDGAIASDSSGRPHGDNPQSQNAASVPGFRSQASGDRAVNRKGEERYIRRTNAEGGHNQYQQSQAQASADNPFSTQLEMAQVAAPRQPSSLNTMGHMVHALPQQYPYRQEQQYQGHQAQQQRQQQQQQQQQQQHCHQQQMQFGQQISQPHASLSPMAQMNQMASPYGPGPMTFAGPQYYMPPQPQIPQGYYQGPHLGHSQQAHHAQAMPSRIPAPYYQPPVVVSGQPPGYYYPPVASSSPYSVQHLAQPPAMPTALASGNNVDPRTEGRVQPAVAGRAELYPDGDGERAESGADSVQGHATNVVRGPPRKPRQSGHAIWIGNLPPQTALMALVHHVCELVPGLESLFLISKSNCAFANFKDEAMCMAAQQAIHDSTFQSMRLVSRLRKSTVEGAAGITAPTGPSLSTTGQHQSDAPVAPRVVPDGDHAGPPTAPASASRPSTGTGGAASALPRDRFFILKSLTVEDLDLSVRTGVWATQSHNEQMLTSAFKSGDNVYLVFSANKSGEYFGFARMTSSINEDPKAAIEFAPKVQATDDLLLPRSYVTEATEAAPKGSVIDDSARGTIFWEADRGADDASTEAGSLSEHVDGEGVDGNHAVMPDGEAVEDEAKIWGKPFKVEWQSTTRLPFYRTRGLRNPWNSNREVKIARDGTELEPSVGRRLVALFSTQPLPGQIPGPQPGMPPAVGIGHAPIGYPPRGLYS